MDAINQDNMQIQDDIMVRIEKSAYAQKAGELFVEGYNCSQAVFLAFEELYALDRKVALMISSSFGGGMGRLREVCGAVSGMFLVAGILYGYSGAREIERKKEHYARIQYLANEFKKYNPSIICRELLGIQTQIESPIPETRTEQYYKKRPCIMLVKVAAVIMEEYIQANPLS